MGIINFSTDRKKFPKLWEKVADNRVRIEFFEYSEDIVVREKNKVKNTAQTFSKQVDYSTDFEPPELYHDTDLLFPGEDEDPSLAFKNWEFVLEGLKRKHLALIKPEIIFKFNNEDNPDRLDLNSGGSFYFNYYFSEEDLEDTTNKIFTLHVGFVYNFFLLKEDFQVKLFMKLINPYSFR